MDYDSYILDGLKNTKKFFYEEAWPDPEVASLKIQLHKSSGLEKEESNEIAHRLIEDEYVVLENKDYDEDTKIEEIDISKFKQDIDYTEPLNLPIEEADMNKIEIAREFAEWLVRERKDIKTVKLDPTRNSKQIWHYDCEEKIWKKGGEDKVSEILYKELPQEHSSYLEKETKTKVHRIDPITIEETGTEQGEVPVKNGILSIDDQELREIQRNDYLNSKIPVEYETESSAPEEFQKFLNEVTRSEEDIKKLQEFIGYCLMTETAKYEKALMILGPTDSGKSVFLDIVRELLGSDNIAQQSLQDLTNGRKWGLANIVGTIANIDHDLDPEAIEDIGTVKKITSGNPITVEPKYKQPYDYTPTAKHLFSANRTPSRDKEDEAFYNRWLTVVFPRSIPKEKQDPELLEKLTEQENLKKILNWAITGYHRLENKGQFTGENGAFATRDIWKEWGNSIERFISKFMVTERKKRKKMKKKDEYSREEIKNLECKIHTSTAYRVYQKYAVGLDMEVKSKKAFSSEVKKLKGVKKTKPRIGGTQKRGFKAVELIEQADKLVEERIEEKSKW